MKIIKNIELIEIANEHMAIRVGSEAASHKGIIVLTEAAAFLLNSMKHDKTKEELIELLIDKYDVDINVASVDVDRFIQKIRELGLLED